MKGLYIRKVTEYFKRYPAHTAKFTKGYFKSAEVRFNKIVANNLLW